ncbi:hypothetical protein CKJ90_14810, partial [Klebsiella pneumoniae]
SAEQLPGLAQYLAAARPALVSQVSVLLAVVPEHHLRGLVSTGRQRGAIAGAGAVPGGGASGAGIAGFRAAGGGTGATTPPGSIWRSRCATGGGVSFSAEPG